MRRILNQIDVLRHDDHRLYHQCRINQSLHFVSAISFLVAYALLFVDPATAGLVGWGLGMVTRQSGHIFFEPRGYDRLHDMTDEHKESIKVGYNMRRKAILIGVWLALPLLLAIDRAWFGLLSASTGVSGFIHDVGMLWLALGAGGLLFRTVHLFFLRDVSWGIAWALKILTDPFHNIAIYWRSPLALIRGERYDPSLAGMGPAHAASPTAS